MCKRLSIILWNNPFPWVYSPEAKSNDYYWRNLHTEWNQLPTTKAELNLVKCINTGYLTTFIGSVVPCFNKNPQYQQLQIIAKYWHRFGRLPDVELLKELV